MASEASGSTMRVSVDIGGTFTDLVVEQDSRLRLFKSPTVPNDPVQGILNVLTMAAGAEGASLGAFLGRVESFVHATTRALNAVLTGTTARTAFLTTSGHPDILLLREGGRRRPVRLHRPVPRARTSRARSPSRCRERIGPAGAVLRPLDEAALIAPATELIEERWRRSPSACCGRSSTRLTSCAVGELLRAPAAGRAVHALARAQPVAARVPPRLLGRASTRR